MGRCARHAGARSERLRAGPVTVALYRLDELEGQPVAHFHGTCIDDQDIDVDNYAFDAALLTDAASGKVVEETLVSHLLKSNCLITHQPDWGSVQIQYRGPKIDREKLLRYLVSFRHHNEFHEQCVERIFTDIQRFCQPEKLSVYARYTRRGGLDINPWRTNTDFVPATGRLGAPVKLRARVVKRHKPRAIVIKREYKIFVP